MKETGGPNLQCFRRKTALKMALSWASKSCSQQTLTLQACAEPPQGLVPLRCRSSPKLCRAQCGCTKLGRLCSLGRRRSAATTAPFCCSQRRKETRLGARSGLAVVAALARQAGSAAISKMYLCREINYKADCCPLKLAGTGSGGTRPHAVYGTSVVQGRVFRKAV